MPKSTYNLSKLTNQDLLALRKKSQKFDSLQIKIGGKRIDLRSVEAHLITTEDSNGGLYSFISIPAVSAILGKTSTGDELVRDSEKAEALRMLKAAGRAKRTRRVAKEKAEPQLTPELLRQLKDLQAIGGKVVAGPDGYRVRKIRGKRKN